MTTSMMSTRGTAAILLILAIMVCVLVAASRKVDVAFASNPADISTPTHAPFYGMVELAKPTYTSTPVIEPPTPTALAPIELSATLESTVQAEVIPDTPIPGHIESDPTAASNGSPGYGGNKYVLVDISEQHMYVYEGDALVYSFVASTGMNNATRVGSFSVLDKIPNAYGATWDLWMPNWLGIYWSGTLENGIHALPILSNGTQLWAGYLGTPISFGCVVLGVNESQLLYDWVEVGTPVDIQW